MNSVFRKKTKIIATYGPACQDPEVLKNMVNNGTDLFRLNMSHNDDFSELEAVVKKIRSISKSLNKHIGIFCDLQGPKIRIGEFSKGPVTLKPDDNVILTSKKIDCTEKKLHVDYKHIAKDVSVGDDVFIDDGKLCLTVTNVSDDDVHCKVKVGGVVSNHKGVNFPQTILSIPAFTEKDKKDAITGIKLDIDYIALSFVSTKYDVVSFKDFLANSGGEHIKIISKIEKQQAVENYVGIIEESDAIMVARGDLGVEVGVENVPKLQKEIIQTCNKKIKPVIVATQMLESMIKSITATRAEVSDIANAIYDNCDAVMLSGETAVGIDPANVVKIMSNICAASDHHLAQMKQEVILVRKKIFEFDSVATSICKAADQIAEENNAKVVMSFTSSGNTPLIASKINSTIPIIAPTDDERICRRMSLYKGVKPMMLPKMYSDIHRWTDMINISVKHALNLKWVSKGDRVVVTAGIPIGQSNGINSIRIINI